MDSKEYIASGIIERYVLGLVSPQEKQEVECMSHIYPEIGEELKLYQDSIEQLAIKGAVNPPAFLKGIVMERVRSEKQIAANSSTSEAKIIALKPQPSNFYKYAAAASVLLVVGLGIGLLNSRMTSSDLNAELAAMSSQQDSLKINVNLAAERIAFMSDVNTSKVKMVGTEAHPDMMATVYWNSNNQKVMLKVNELVSLPAEKQYQLWAIVDGQPKDMGVFDMTSSILEMKNTASAEAFAVTVEPKGGSVSPTMDQLYVIGTI
ncbi:MAG: anti-sigma factor [Bacteroidota bacterium]